MKARDGMNGLQIFESICNETTKNPNGTFFTISSSCEENGEFEIVLSGNGGAEIAKMAITRASESIDKQRTSIFCK